MIRFAVVEDSNADRAELCRCIGEYMSGKKESFEIKTYSDGMNFITGYKPEFDCIFMDIEMPLLNGMASAKKLRETDKSVLLVFVTQLKHYAVYGYGVGASDYLIKPIEPILFERMMARILHAIEKKEKKEIFIHTNAGVARVPEEDVYYPETRGHYVIYHTAQGEISHWSSLAAAEKTLEEKTFFRCNSCYLVNLGYVKKISGDTVFVAGAALLRNF